MPEKVTIPVSDLIGSNLCIAADDGQKIYAKIVELLKLKREIVVSFDRITMLISLFLNNAIGQLYKDYTDAELSVIEYTGLSADDQKILERVIDNAKKYYASQQNFDEAWNKEAEEHDEE